MTREELISRIEKSNIKIGKIEKRIQKWTAGMNDEAKALVAACELVYEDPKYKEAYNNYRAYADQHEYDPTVFNQNDWNKGPQMGEAYNAYRDLAEAKKTLHKYEVALDKLVNFDNAEKIEVIWGFLQEWKAQVRQFVIDGCELLGRLNEKEAEAFEEWKQSDLGKERTQFYSSLKSNTFSPWNLEYNLRYEFREWYFADVPSLSYKFYTRKGQYNEQALEKFLDQEARARYEDLVHRITEKAGQILSADGLYIARDGNINGIVIGSKNKVKVETISAEGPVQRFHYRVLVHVIK